MPWLCFLVFDSKIKSRITAGLLTLWWKSSSSPCHCLPVFMWHCLRKQLWPNKHNEVMGKKEHLDRSKCLIICWSEMFTHNHLLNLLERVQKFENIQWIAVSKKKMLQCSNNHPLQPLDAEYHLWTCQTLKLMGNSSRRQHWVMILSARTIPEARLQFSQPLKNDLENIVWSDEHLLLLWHSENRDPSCIGTTVQVAAGDVTVCVAFFFTHL